MAQIRTSDDNVIGSDWYLHFFQSTKIGRRCSDDTVIDVAFDFLDK